MMRLARVLLGGVGVGVGIYGASLMKDLGWDNFVASAKWLVGGVVLHDGVIAPATIVLALLVARVRRRPLPGAVIVGGIVVASVSLAALPVLGRFGARADNPTLLPRDYLAGWSAFAGLTLLIVGIAVWVSNRSTKGR